MVFLHLPGEFFKEMVRQQGDIFPALPEGREFDGDDVNAVEQVFPESAFSDFRLERFIGRGDDPDIHLDRLIASNGKKRPLPPRPVAA